MKQPEGTGGTMARLTLQQANHIIDKAIEKARQSKVK